MQKIRIVFILLVLNFTNSQRQTTNNCPQLSRFQSFDVSQFIGTWYIIATYPDQFAKNVRCATVTYTWATAGNNKSELGAFRKIVSFGSERSFLGTASTVAPGVLGINFPTLTSESGYFIVLETDYFNYAILYTCNNYSGFISGQNLIVMSRRRTLEFAYLQRTLAVINANKLSTFWLRPIDQGCNNHPYSYNNFGKR